MIGLRYADVFDDVLGAGRLLRDVAGPTPKWRRKLILRMAAGPVAFVSVAERIQAGLSGL